MAIKENSDISYLVTLYDCVHDFKLKYVVSVYSL